MKKFIQNKLKEQKGLTLIELLAVIVILAIIAAIAIPAISGIIDNSRVGAIKSDATNAFAAAEIYKIDAPKSADGTVSPVTVKTLVDNQFLDDKGTLDESTSITFGTKSSLNTISTGDKPAKSGSITITFTNATKAKIAATPNSQRGEKDSKTFTISGS